MGKILRLVAATALSILSFTVPALAGGGSAIGFGIAGFGIGALLGSALAPTAVYVGPPGYYYDPYYYPYYYDPYYGPEDYGPPPPMNRHTSRWHDEYAWPVQPPHGARSEPPGPIGVLRNFLSRGAEPIQKFDGCLQAQWDSYQKWEPTFQFLDAGGGSDLRLQTFHTAFETIPTCRNRGRRFVEAVFRDVPINDLLRAILRRDV